MSNTPDIQQQLYDIRQDQAEILFLLRQMLNPAASLSAREKAAAVLAAERSGDPKRVKEILRKINNGN